MKSLYKIFGLVIFFTVLSCDLDKDLDNPNEVGPDTADPNLLMNGIQADFGQFFARASGNDAVFTNGADQIMRMKAMTGGDRYETGIRPENLSQTWQDAYQKVLVNIEAMIPLAEENNLTTHVAAGKILKAYTYMILVDLFGDVPATNAVKGLEGILNPAPDAGSEIYAMALTLLDEARTELAKTGNEAGPGLTRDVFYGGNRARWTTLANTLELRAWLNISALPARAAEATAEISALMTANDLIDTDAEEFTYKYGTANVPTRSRHPLYLNDYPPQLGAAGGYIGTYILKQVFNGTGVQDPRWRYYFYRQVGSLQQALTIDGESLGCVNPNGAFQNAPLHYVQNNFTFCAFDPGFMGRDHGDNAGGPPDGNVKTAIGVYPGGERLDTNNGLTTFHGPTQQGQGGNGQGIEPIFMSFFTDFMKAEAVLRLGVAGDAKAFMVSGINKSINRVRNFAAALGQTLPAGVEPSQVTYRTRVEAMYDAADDAGKLDIAIKEFYKSAFGNGLEAYNMYRRTSSPKDIQWMRAVNPGEFMRSLVYPSNYIANNREATQKASNGVRVFWDGNPEELK